MQCVVTSPPYWGLRKYEGEQELVWGGQKNCRHDWTSAGRRGAHPDRPTGGKDANGSGVFVPGPREQAAKKARGEAVQFGNACKCGAWRGAYGLEPAVEMYVEHTVEILHEVRRVLRPDGVCFWNIGDSYASAWSCNRRSVVGQGAAKAADRVDRISKSKRIDRGNGRWGGGNNTSAGLKEKDLCLIPFRVALAAQADGWWVRSDIVWAKPNPMPESATDRPTRAHEYVLMLTKSANYFWDADAVREPQTGNAHSRRTDGKRDGTGTKVDSAIRGTHAGWRDEYIEVQGGRNLRSVWTFPSQPYSGWGETSRHVRVEADEAGDGTKRITSPDCPLHGGSSGSAPSAPCDGREDDSASHSEHSESCLAPEQPALYEPTDQLHGDCPAAGNSDSPVHSSSDAAIGHSKETHRKGRVPSTNQPCKPCAETPSRTGRNVKAHGGSGSAGRISENNTGLGGSGGHLSVGTESRNASKSCTCEYYNTITEETSHFATFPEELAARCITAATSERGACVECGAPWERIVEASGGMIGKSWHDHEDDLGKGQNATAAARGYENDYRRETVGWQPGCKCGTKETRPCLVLDPFAGSGTVGEVAFKMGRRFILSDLAYQEQQLKRVPPMALVMGSGA